MTKRKTDERERFERRFVARSTISPSVLKVLGGSGAALLGAGSWAMFGNALREVPIEPLNAAPYILGLGVATTSVALVLASRRAPTLRVGDPGIGLETNATEVRRMAWHALESVCFDRDAVVATGKDETGAPFAVRVSTETHAGCAAFLVAEARARVPAKVDIPEGVRPSGDDGEQGVLLIAESLQVVGRKCAASGRTVAFEPDARVCPSCERVFHKDSLPSRCECGRSLAGLGEAGELSPT